MGRFVIRKAVQFLLMTWLFMTAVFFLFRLLPGGPFDLEQNFSKEVLQKLMQYWGLDQPLLVQYAVYFKNLISGHFGYSISNPNESVVSTLLAAFKNTFLLNSLALFCIVCGSIAASFFIIRKKESALAKVIEQLLIFFSSFPAYFLAPFLVYFFCFRWELLPIAYLESAKSYILPVLAMSLRPLSQLARVQVKNWSEVLSQPFIRTAFAKGLSRNQIIWNHGFRSSLGGLLSWLSPLIVGLYSGSLIIESLFSIPGLGSLFLQSISERDYPVMMGCSIIFGCTLILFSSLSELLQIFLNPRLQMELEGEH